MIRADPVLMAIFETPTPTGTPPAPAPERVAGVLARTVGPCLRHDRHGAGEITACVAMGPAGVYVILPWQDDGKVAKRVVGGRRQPDERLYVGTRDRTDLLDVVDAQVGHTVAVLGRHGLDSVPVFGVLCLVGTRWPLFGSRALRFRGATALWPDELAGHVRRPGRLDAAVVAAASGALTGALHADRA